MFINLIKRYHLFEDKTKKETPKKTLINKNNNTTRNKKNRNQIYNNTKNNMKITFISYKPSLTEDIMDTQIYETKIINKIYDFNKREELNKNFMKYFNSYDRLKKKYISLISNNNNIKKRVKNCIYLPKLKKKKTKKEKNYSIDFYDNSETPILLSIAIQYFLYLEKKYNENDKDNQNKLTTIPIFLDKIINTKLDKVNYDKLFHSSVALRRIEFDLKEKCFFIEKNFGLKIIFIQRFIRYFIYNKIYPKIILIQSSFRSYLLRAKILKCFLNLFKPFLKRLYGNLNLFWNKLVEIRKLNKIKKKFRTFKSPKKKVSISIIEIPKENEASEDNNEENIENSFKKTIISKNIIENSNFNSLNENSNKNSNENSNNNVNENSYENSDENLNENSQENSDENFKEICKETLNEYSKDNFKENSENLKENLKENSKENSKNNLNEKSNNNLNKDEDFIENKNDEQLTENNEQLNQNFEEKIIIESFSGNSEEKSKKNLKKISKPLSENIQSKNILSKYSSTYSQGSETSKKKIDLEKNLDFSQLDKNFEMNNIDKNLEISNLEKNLELSNLEKELKPNINLKPINNKWSFFSKIIIIKNNNIKEEIKEEKHSFHKSTNSELTDDAKWRIFILFLTNVLTKIIQKKIFNQFFRKNEDKKIKFQLTNSYNLKHIKNNSLNVKIENNNLFIKNIVNFEMRNGNHYKNYSIEMKNIEDNSD